MVVSKKVTTQFKPETDLERPTDGDPAPAGHSAGTVGDSENPRQGRWGAREENRLLAALYREYARCLEQTGGGEEGATADGAAAEAKRGRPITVTNAWGIMTAAAWGRVAEEVGSRSKKQCREHARVLKRLEERELQAGPKRPAAGARADRGARAGDADGEEGADPDDELWNQLVNASKSVKSRRRRGAAPGGSEGGDT